MTTITEEQRLAFIANLTVVARACDLVIDLLQNVAEDTLDVTRDGVSPATMSDAQDLCANLGI